VSARALAEASRLRFLVPRSHGAAALGDTSRTMNKKKIPAAIVFALALAAAGARADWLGPPSSVFFEGGMTSHDAYNAILGFTVPFTWRHEGRGGEFTAYAELFAGEWRAKVGDDRRSTAQVAIVPLLRFRFGQGGRSDWFAEGGIGASYFSNLYERDDKHFSTRFNFHDTIGLGRSFGAHREHELTLRLSHISNAGIKHPNPGENFVQLRYAHSF
jgi:lipid A 3-O-deacylase